MRRFELIIDRGKLTIRREAGEHMTVRQRFFLWLAVIGGVVSVELAKIGPFGFLTCVGFIGILAAIVYVTTKY